ncbi:hypothetical protein NQX30_06000 [Candidatus Persebacteraceae bacterium Df01]|jgi:hypothetical protein|uniref:Glycosyltransferase RgtA/B/C/D-like domain-containing protein n=1 Tax=Candidatus Doriopsillibacter californiensis TaxID=2970740 RepID=A0ABT7QMI9_9GAMM|nr:hypothetical protein [Candidatus Persebacteraceae bacterium Df01]
MSALRLPNHNQAADEPLWRSFWLCLIAAFGLRLLFISNDDVYRADEVFQYLEQAHRLVFGSGHVMWEQRLGMRTPLIYLPAAAILQLLKATGFEHPDFYIPVIKIFNILCSLILPAGMYIISRRLYSEQTARLALFTGIIWHEFLYFSTRTLPELYATYLLFAALIFFSSNANWLRAATTGLLIGLAVAVRVPYAPPAALLAFILLLSFSTARAQRNFIIGGIVALLLWGAVDAIFLGSPWLSMINYFRVYVLAPNEVAQVRLQIDGDPFLYLKHLTKNSFLLFPLVFAIGCFFWRRHKILIALIIAVVLPHVHQISLTESYIFLASPFFLILLADIASKKRLRVIVISSVFLISAIFIIGMPHISNGLLFKKSPFIETNRRLSRQPENDVRSVYWTRLGNFNYNMLAPGGYYYFHHKAPVFFEIYSQHQKLFQAAEMSLQQAFSHVILDSYADISGFHLISSYRGIYIYRNNDPQQVTPPNDYIYDYFSPHWYPAEKKIIELGIIPQPPLTPFVAEEK